PDRTRGRPPSGRSASTTSARTARRAPCATTSPAGSAAWSSSRRATRSTPPATPARDMPTLVAERTALLLLTPTSAVTSLSVTVRVGGQVRATLPLAPPSAIPRDDVADSQGRPDVVYSTRAWS